MADYVPLNGEPAAAGGGGQEEPVEDKPGPARRRARVASVDVFRGLAIALMIFVDYAGSVFPYVAHSPWDGVRLADFVMPFFLFIAGVSLSIVHEKTNRRLQATQKAILRAMKLFLLGIFLQGGYFHGINSLTFGVDIEKIRWLGILQRIAIGYIIAALCEIWSSKISWMGMRHGFFRNYYMPWFLIVLLSSIYLGLLHGLYVPDWQFNVQETSCLVSSEEGCYVTNTVKCGVTGDLGPACNSGGMIDRYFLGIEHLYKKPAYRNLEVCKSSANNESQNDNFSWCKASFEPEGILSSLMAAVTCIIGLHFGHVLIRLEGHKDRLLHWSLFSLSILIIALLLTLLGIPLNKQLYTLSYTLLTTASAGIVFCALYLLVDVYGHRRVVFVLEWMGRHSLSIFVLVASNIAVISMQGFYWRNPKNNIVHWIVSLVTQH